MEKYVIKGGKRLQGEVTISAAKNSAVAILPAALSQIVAWAGMRLETNFSECAILGMVGAGGIGYVISNSLQGYDYGTAGVAILLVFLVAYCIERIFVRIKKRFS